MLSDTLQQNKPGSNTKNSSIKSKDMYKLEELHEETLRAMIRTAVKKTRQGMMNEGLSSKLHRMRQQILLRESELLKVRSKG